MMNKLGVQKIAWCKDGEKKDLEVQKNLLYQILNKKTT